MIRVVLDTNVLVSAAIKPSGPESAVMKLAGSGQVTLCLAASILAEYREVLLRRKFALGPDLVERFLDSMASAAVMVQPERTLVVSVRELIAAVSGRPALDHGD